MLNPCTGQAWQGAARGRRKHGASLIELMVGVTVGLLIVGSAIGLFASHLTSSTQLMFSARLNQELRAAAEVVVRDLRRASYWQNAIQGTIAVGTGSATTANPYKAVTAASGSVDYGFSRDTTENDVLDSTETFGFRLTSTGVLEMQTAQGTWVAMTDLNLVRVTAFTVTPTVTSLALGDLCPTTCAIGSPNCPTSSVRRFDVLLRGQSARDSTLVRELRMAVRLRNDRLDGQCPA